MIWASLLAGIFGSRNPEKKSKSCSMEMDILQFHELLVAEHMLYQLLQYTASLKGAWLMHMQTQLTFLSLINPNPSAPNHTILRLSLVDLSRVEARFFP